jgi:hypothetical protein
MPVGRPSIIHERRTMASALCLEHQQCFHLNWLHLAQLCAVSCTAEGLSSIPARAAMFCSSPERQTGSGVVSRDRGFFPEGKAAGALAI